MVRNIRNLFLRAGLFEQEVRTLHGIVTELSTGRGEPEGADKEQAGGVRAPAPRAADFPLPTFVSGGGAV